MQVNHVSDNKLFNHCHCHVVGACIASTLSCACARTCIMSRVCPAVYYFQLIVYLGIVAFNSLIFSFQYALIFVHDVQNDGICLWNLVEFPHELKSLVENRVVRVVAYLCLKILLLVGGPHLNVRIRGTVGVCWRKVFALVNVETDLPWLKPRWRFLFPGFVLLGIKGA